MRVFVVMGNDFPEAVYSNMERAQAFVEEKQKETKGRTIYWRVYQFTLDYPQ